MQYLDEQNINSKTLNAWLSQACENVHDTACPDFESITLPLVVFTDEATVTGSDYNNAIMETHAITVERYTVDGEESQALEILLRQQFKYTKVKYYDNSNSYFQEIYELETIYSN
jgi:hypothetical protein